MTGEGMSDATVRVSLRPVGNSMVLGLFGLAGATLTVAALELGWIPKAQQHEVGLLVIAVAPVSQLVASIFGFLARDPLAGGCMGWLSGSWLAYGLILLVSPVGATTPALGAYLVVAGVGLVAVAAGADSEKGIASVVMASAGLRFLTSAIYELSGAHSWGIVAGWIGVVLCALALYAALALALEDLRRRPVLPTLRRGDARAMFNEPVSEQVRDVAAEAGVRRQL